MGISKEKTFKPAEERIFPSWLAPWERLPWHLSPDKEGTREIFKDLELVKEKLKEKYGNDFISIAVYGSRALGYATKESDLDLHVIVRRKLDWLHGEDKAMAKEIEALIGQVRQKKGYEVEVHHVAGLEDMKGGPATALHPEYLFMGIHFGDRQVLEAARKEVVESIAAHPDNAGHWEEIRRRFHIETGLNKDAFFMKHREKGGEILEKYKGKILRATAECLESLELPNFEEMRKHYR